MHSKGRLPDEKVEQVDRVDCKVDTEPKEQMSMQSKGRGRY